MCCDFGMPGETIANSRFLTIEPFGMTDLCGRAVILTPSAPCEVEESPMLSPIVMTRGILTAQSAQQLFLAAR